MIRMKKFKHKKIEICKISKKPIDTQKSRYCIILDCNGDDIEDIGFYKTDILRDLLLKNGERVAKAVTGNIINTAQSMLEGLGITKPVYEIT